MRNITVRLMRIESYRIQTTQEIVVTKTNAVVIIKPVTIKVWLQPHPFCQCQITTTGMCSVWPSPAPPPAAARVGAIASGGLVAITITLAFSLSFPFSVFSAVTVASFVTVPLPVLGAVAVPVTPTTVWRPCSIPLVFIDVHLTRDRFPVNGWSPFTTAAQ